MKMLEYLPGWFPHVQASIMSVAFFGKSRSSSSLWTPFVTVTFLPNLDEILLPFLWLTLGIAPCEAYKLFPKESPSVLLSSSSVNLILKTQLNGLQYFKKIIYIKHIIIWLEYHVEIPEWSPAIFSVLVDISPSFMSWFHNDDKPSLSNSSSN